MSSLKCYELINCQHLRSDNNCTLCGVFLTDTLQAYKTERYRTQGFIPTLRYLRSLRRSQRKPLQGKFSFSEDIYSHLQRLVEKFQFGMETLALSIYLFNHLYDKHPELQREYDTKSYFYSSVAVMVAAKAIELDKKIPYYSRFQRHVDLSHSKEEYEKAESQMFDLLEFDVQIPTFVTYINYCLSNGILFSDDALNKKNVFVVEEKVKELTFKALKSGVFVTKNPEQLALSIVLKARRECQLPWNPAIQKYSLIPLSDMEDSNILQPLSTNVNSALSSNISNLSLHKNNVERPTPSTSIKYVYTRSVHSSLGFASNRVRNM